MLIPDLAITEDDDGLIGLQQSIGSGEFASILIHPVHVRVLAEQIGLVPTSDPHALKTIATLSRRLRVLYDSIDDLSDWFLAPGRGDHEEMSDGLAMAMGAWKMASEFLLDLDHQSPPLVKTPENGGVQHPQERGSFRGPDPAVQPSEAVPKSAPLGKNGTASPKTNAERQRAFRQRRRNEAKAEPVTGVTPNPDQLEIAA